MQNWNHVLDYIKLNLGAPLNLIEMPDDDLIKHLKEHVLPVFSQYVPHKKYCYINEGARLPVTNAGNPRYSYNIPLQMDEYIVDIHDVYHTRSTILTDNNGLTTLNHFGAIDTVIANTYIDAIRSLGTHNTWEFMPPDTMVFDEKITAAIIVYGTPHTDLLTVPPDMYQLIFKKMCLGQASLWIAAMRSKYDNLTTSFGPLPINWQDLRSEGQRMMEEVNQQLLTLPPDKFVEFSLF